MGLFSKNTPAAATQGIAMPVMSLREVVMFPHAIMPLFVGRDASIKAIESALAAYDKRIFLVTQREAVEEKPSVTGLYRMGVVSRILQVLRLPDGSIKVLFEGLYRAHWETLDPTAKGDLVFGDAPYPVVVTHQVPELQVGEGDTPPSPEEREALVRATHEALEEFGKGNKLISHEQMAAIAGLRDMGRLADALIPHLKVEYPRKQEVLEQLEPYKRLTKVFELLGGEMAVSNLEKTIKNRVKTQMERNQREYYLSEQIKAIQKEMGREDDPQAELVDIEKRLLEKNMPEDAREKAIREVKKLRHIQPSSPEYTVLRNYLDWVLDLPWNETKETHINIKEAAAMLDADHYGLEKPKERILEYLAVQRLSGTLKGPILCFVGPPGVGKTSLAKSVARATGREFVRLSLGGVRDEAEIRGHRRTYIGAMPGKILMSLKRAKYNNPLFCLDEIDKMTADFRGDPASALLEVLDPEQNNTFADHYLDMDYDLSQIFFITTANSLNGIPAPLLDRMEIIHLSSYLETEKTRIARNFILPKQIEAHGLKPGNIRISDSALLEVIRSYTREAGVRNLEREIAALCRKVAVRLVTENPDLPVPVLVPENMPENMPEGMPEDVLGGFEEAMSAEELEGAAVAKGGKKEEEQTEKADTPCVAVTLQNLHSFLGIKKYRFGERENEPHIGLCAGLAFNDRGGEILYMETTPMPGSGKIIITGHLGDVMKESAQAALSYVRSRAEALGLRPDFHKDIDLHIHVPEGATPKDGPSAGIALATSISSALLGIPVKNDLAMTGEITLRGRVLPIGGLREKLLAARRVGMATVLIPAQNEKDLKDVPEEILKSLHIIFVDHADEVLPLALDAPYEAIFQNPNPAPLTAMLRPAAVSEVRQ